MSTTPKASQIVTMASGAVMFIFGFLAWWKASTTTISGVSFGGTSVSAWGSGLFPLATVVPLFGLIAGGVMAATVWANVRLPEPILDFTWRQIHFVLAFTALVISVGYLLVDGPSKGIGFWFCFLGSIGLIVGAVMALLEGGATITGPSSSGGEPRPF